MLVPQFPGISWAITGNSLFGYLWSAYTLSFERVLAQWEAGIFEQIGPAEPLPWGGLWGTIRWSRNRGESKQMELIG